MFAGNQISIVISIAVISITKHHFHTASYCEYMIPTMVTNQKPDNHHHRKSLSPCCSGCYNCSESPACYLNKKALFDKDSLKEKKFQTPPALLNKAVQNLIFKHVLTSDILHRVVALARANFLGRVCRCMEICNAWENLSWR